MLAPAGVQAALGESHEVHPVPELRPRVALQEESKLVDTEMQNLKVSIYRHAL